MNWNTLLDKKFKIIKLLFKTINNCLTCNNSTICTSSGNITYLKLDNSYCVVDCVVIDIGIN